MASALRRGHDDVLRLLHLFPGKVVRRDDRVVFRVQAEQRRLDLGDVLLRGRLCVVVVCVPKSTVSPLSVRSKA